MKRWFVFNGHIHFFVSLILTFVVGCSSPYSHLSRPGNPENYNQYLLATVELVELTSAGSMVGPNCTAFFISPRQLATAKHCVVDNGRIIEILPGVGERILLTPEPTIGREILFVTLGDEEEWAEQTPRPVRGPSYHRTKVVAVDDTHDVAVLELADNETDWLCWFEIRDTTQYPVLAGEKVYTISNPVGLSFILSEGIVSRVRTTRTEQRIFHQVRIGPGSSGSPLIDHAGRVIGINVSITRDGYVSIAIPISYLQTQIRILANYSQNHESPSGEE